MAFEYFTGFETGDTSEIQTLGGGSSIVTTPIHSGAYALQNGGTASLLRSNIAETQLSYRGYFRCPDSGSNQPIARIVSTGTSNGLNINVTTGSRLIRAQDQGAILGFSNTNGTTALAVNVWHLLEIQIDWQAGGIIRVWVNGNLEVNITHTLGPGTNLAVQFRGDTSPNETQHDTVRVKDGLVRLGAGISIARQGITGAPTYNAWAKSSGSDAFSLWSDTPFNATTFCSEATTVGDAQTMLIAPFSSTQTGHGTEVLKATDIVNACKVAIIAKRAAGGDMDIRRRVGGADTDTAKTVTTSDAYYDDGVWTATAAQLDAMEAGAQHTVAGTTTVEDVWVMLDFTPVVVPVDATLGHTATPPGLTQAHTLPLVNATLGHTATPPSLTQTYTVTLVNATVGHTATPPSLSLLFSISFANVTLGHQAIPPGIMFFQHGTTPRERTRRVIRENRTYRVVRERRVYRVKRENRTYRVSEE